MKRRDRRTVVSVLVSAVVTLAIAGIAIPVLIASGRYGWSLFVAIPVFIGFFCTVLLRWRGPQPLSVCMRTAFAVTLLLSFGFLFLRAEGVICMLLAAPLCLPGVAIGVWMAFLLVHRRDLMRPSMA